MIIIERATSKPVENDELWSYPVSELDHILIDENDGCRYLLWEGRLYETAID